MTQRWDPDTYAAHGRFVSELGEPVADLLAPRPGDRILDLGCGDGALTERLRTAGGVVVAIDSSPEQVWAALERGLDARIIDVATVDPWYFPTAAQYQDQLESRGFRVDSIQLFPRPTPLPGDITH